MLLARWDKKSKKAGHRPWRRGRCVAPSRPDRSSACSLQARARSGWQRSAVEGRAQPAPEPSSKRDSFSLALVMVNKSFFGRAAHRRRDWPKARPFSVWRSGRDARGKRAGHAGPAQSAVACRILGQILLVIILGEIERTCRRDFGRDGVEALGRKRLLVSGVGGGRSLALSVSIRIDRGA